MDEKYIKQLDTYMRFKFLPQTIPNDAFFALVSTACSEVISEAKQHVGRNPLGLNGHVDGNSLRVLSAANEKIKVVSDQFFQGYENAEEGKMFFEVKSPLDGAVAEYVEQRQNAA